MRLVIQYEDFLAAAKVLRIEVPPSHERHDSLQEALRGVAFAQWRTMGAEVTLTIDDKQLLETMGQFWATSFTSVRASEVLAALALTSAALPSLSQHLLDNLPPREADIIEALEEQAKKVGRLQHRVLGLYMASGFSPVATATNILSSLLVRRLALEKAAWLTICSAIDAFGATPCLCATAAKYLLENNRWGQAAALFSSEIEGVCIAAVSSPAMVGVAMSAVAGMITPPELLRASAMISQAMTVVGCPSDIRVRRLREISLWLSVPRGVGDICNVDGMAISEGTAKLCVSSTEPPSRNEDRAEDIALRCLSGILSGGLAPLVEK